MASARIALPAAIVAASVAVLGAAFAFQYLGGLAPCPLCIWQRWPYAVTIALGVLALALSGRANPAPFVALAGLTFLAGAGIAGFHVGVEQGWWAGLETCAGGGPIGGRSLADVLQGAQAPAGPRCDEVPWSLFGISMAGYNLIVSLGLAALALAGARRLWRTQ